MFRQSSTPGATIDPEQVESILSLGYLSGSTSAPVRTGITVDDPNRSFRGLNLVTSGHAPEAYLMDMSGRILHRWSKRFEDVWPAGADSPDGAPRGSQYWRRVHLFANGDLIAIFDGLGIIKLDRDSRLIWSQLGGYHHDIDVAADGTLFTLTRETKVIPRVNRDKAVREDFVAILDSQGQPRGKISLLECFERSPYTPMLASMKREGDIFHTNTIEVLDGRWSSRSPAFARGNILISIRELSTIAIVDLEEHRIVWALSGMWRFQHQPTFLANGNLLLFDNAGTPQNSRVIEFDPLTQVVTWMYSGEKGNALFTYLCGSCQRQPNGNTLITESDNGRALEVTSAGEVVWEYVNPRRAGSNSELIATLFEVVRVPESDVAEWLQPVTKQ